MFSFCVRFLLLELCLLHLLVVLSHVVLPSRSTRRTRRKNRRKLKEEALKKGFLGEKRPKTLKHYKKLAFFCLLAATPPPQKNRSKHKT